MTKPDKKEKEPFNAVIEGSFHDEWWSFHYKIAQLEIPKRATILNDSTHRYKLYGITDDFKYIRGAEDSSDGLEFLMDFKVGHDLATCEGVLLPHDKKLDHSYMMRPRAVVLRDGRIYIDDSMRLIWVEYSNAVHSSIIQTAGGMFKTKKLAKSYDDIKRPGFIEIKS